MNRLNQKPDVHPTNDRSSRQWPSEPAGTAAVTDGADLDRAREAITYYRPMEDREADRAPSGDPPQAGGDRRQG